MPDPVVGNLDIPATTEPLYLSVAFNLTTLHSKDVDGAVYLGQQATSLVDFESNLSHFSLGMGSDLRGQTITINVQVEDDSAAPSPNTVNYHVAGLTKDYQGSQTDPVAGSRSTTFSFTLTFQK